MYFEKPKKRVYRNRHSRHSANDDDNYDDDDDEEEEEEGSSYEISDILSEISKDYQENDNTKENSFFDLAAEVNIYAYDDD